MWRRCGAIVGVVFVVGCGRSGSMQPGESCTVIASRSVGHVAGPAERACVSDTDCTPAATSCCDCTNGGTQAAINRRSRVTVEERLEAMCGDHTICVNGSACRSFTAACVQRRCELCDDGTN